jgi:hypothetical protein
MISRTLLTCDISLVSLRLPAPETGDFVELIVLYPYNDTFYVNYVSQAHVVNTNKHGPRRLLLKYKNQTRSSNYALAVASTQRADILMF